MTEHGDGISAEGAEWEEQLIETALDHVVRLRSHEVDPAEAERIRRWIDRSPVHADAFAAANRRWAGFRAAALNLTAQERAARTAPVVPRLLGRRALLGGALAGSAAAAAAGWLLLRPPFGLWPL